MVSNVKIQRTLNSFKDSSVYLGYRVSSQIGNKNRYSEIREFIFSQFNIFPIQAVDPLPRQYKVKRLVLATSLPSCPLLMWPSDIQSSPFIPLLIDSSLAASKGTCHSSSLLVPTCWCLFLELLPYSLYSVVRLLQSSRSDKP